MGNDDRIFRLIHSDLVFNPYDRVQTVDGIWLTIKDAWINEDELTGSLTMSWGVEENENFYSAKDFVSRKFAPAKS